MEFGEAGTESKGLVGRGNEQHRLGAAVLGAFLVKAKINHNF